MEKHDTDLVVASVESRSQVFIRGWRIVESKLSRALVSSFLVLMA
jgi:hypothetical protein